MNQYSHSHRHYGEAMLTVEDALARILSFFHVLETEYKPILDSLGQVLADDVMSLQDIPSMANSAMDGYAIQAENVKGASHDSPISLDIIGHVAAGELPKVTVSPGTAVRIMTGAPLPVGADSVVPFEDTDELTRRETQQDMSKISVNLEVEKGSDVRPAGQDIENGQLVLTRGTILRPYEIGVLASLGHAQVKVIRRPIVGILSTGNELMEPGDTYDPSKIYNSNGFSVAAAVIRYGGLPKQIGIARDNLDSIETMLRKGLESDILITSAGVSKGDYDMVKDVLSSHGDIDFWSVKMRPAKPLAFGVLRSDTKKRVPLLGLPGNPVSAIVAFEQFARPSLFKMMGKTRYAKPSVKAILEEPIYNTDNRRVYARVIVEKKNEVYHARLTGHQGSNLLTSMANANGLAICPEDQAIKKAGEFVEVQMLDWPEEVF